MKNLLFCTGNNEKFSNAQLACARYDVTLEQQNLDIDEIQGEDGDAIIRDKLAKAFALVQAPVIVSDDCWEIPGLNGFPGPYMKSINHWFSPEDFLHLTRPLADHSIYLVQRLGFTDGTNTKIWLARVQGTLLEDARGNYGLPLQKVVSMSGDNGLSVGEVYDQGLNTADRHAAGIWHECIDWYTKDTAVVPS